MGIREEMEKHENAKKEGGYIEAFFVNKQRNGIDGVETHVKGKISVNQMKALMVALGADLCMNHGENPIMLSADISAMIMMEMGRGNGD